MFKGTRRAMMLLALLALPRAVMAGSVTYSITGIRNNPYLQNGWTLSGTITTDGTVGHLQSSDITAWTWTVTKGGVSDTYRSTDPGALTFVSGDLLADSSGITMHPGSGPSSSGISLETNRGSLDEGYFAQPGPPPQQPTEPPLQSFLLFYPTSAYSSATQTFYWSTAAVGPEQVYLPIGTPLPGITFATAVVPEPATLYLLGFGAICGVLFVMRYRRREAMRRATA